MSLSLAERLADLSKRTGKPLDRQLAGLSEEEWRDLRWSWRFWARPEQLAPLDAWVVWLVLAGRGWGKGRTAAEEVRATVASGEVEHTAFVAKTPADARDIMIEGPSGILAISPNGERPEWEPSKRRLTWPNGARATVFSGEAPDQLRGPQHQLAWVDELCTYPKPDETWDNLAFGLRIPWKSGGPARAIVTTTPRPMKLLKRIMALRGAAMTRGNTRDNGSNLDPEFLRQVVERYEGTRLGRQEMGGEILDNIVGALWNADELDANRVDAAPELVRVAVAIDPAASSGPLSSETGIVGFGRGVDGDGYVLADVSGVLSPKAWATRAVQLYHRLGANEVVAEVNNGGEMVRQVIFDVDPTVPVRMVRAAVGKMRRAEPVASLYEDTPQHPCRVHHVGAFDELEDQMTSYTGTAGETSPDRLDALVWAAFAVMLEEDVVIV